MITKNMDLTVSIIDMGINGEGIAKHDGAVIFVPFALKDEVVKIHIIYAKSKFYVGKIVEIITPSPYRVKPLCPYFSKCGGCDLQHLEYSQTLNFKTTLVSNTLKNVGKLDVADKVLPCISANQYYYRNKFSFPIGYDTAGYVGMYKENSHNIIKIENCVIQQPWALDVITLFNTFLQSNQNSVYNEQTKEGLIKHLVCRMEQNHLLVCVVVNGKKLNNYDDLIKLLQTKFDSFSLMININELKNNVILTENYKILYGNPQITLNQDGLQYNVSLNSFMQVNTEIATMIYNKVKDTVKNEVVVNAFSGAGFLSGLIAQTAKKVYGIEIVESAHLDAEDLKKNNNISNLVNICGDAKIELPKIKDFEFIVLDPPRKGCGKDVIDTILSVMPNNILYISCNPATLARDLAYLGNNYQIEFVQPYDMFPQTRHVETLVSLKKVKVG